MRRSQSNRRTFNLYVSRSEPEPLPRLCTLLPSLDPCELPVSFPLEGRCDADLGHAAVLS